MLETISAWFYRQVRGWHVILVSVLFIGFTATALPSQSAKAEEYSAGAGSPDLSILYSAEDLYWFADNYGLDGRALYIRSRYTFDIVWPVIYTVFLSISMSWFFRGLIKSRSWIGRSNLLPWVAGGFDLLENLSISFVMYRYPLQTPVFDHLAPIFTLAKWITLGISFILLGYGILVIILRRRS
jgi:hypothetical protein